MLETPHVIVGAAIATKVVNPCLALPLAFASHFILEKVPHWNPHLSTEMRTKGKLSENTVIIIVADSTIAILSVFLISSRLLPNLSRFAIVMAAGFVSALPDLLEAPYYFLKSKISLSVSG